MIPVRENSEVVIIYPYIYIIYISIYQSINYLSIYLVGGTPTPLKNDGVKVSWDDDAIPN